MTFFRLRTLALLSLVSVASVALLGCGDDDDGAATSGASGTAGASGAAAGTAGVSGTSSGTAGDAGAGAGGTQAAGTAGTTSGAAGQAGEGGTGGDGGTGGEGPCEGTLVKRVSGKVESLDGADVAGDVYTICGSVCLTLHLGAEGVFVYDQERCFSKGGSLPRPVFIYHGVSLRTDLYFDFIGPTTSEVDDATIPTLYTIPVDSMSKLSVTSSGSQKLTDGAGFEFGFNGSSVTFPDAATTMAVIAVPPEHRPPVVGMDTVEALWATYPTDVVFDAPATLRLPNAENLAPGTMVEIVALGVNVGYEPYPGTLAKVDDGKVSSDGMSIEAVNGVSNLNWFGYRKLPTP